MRLFLFLCFSFVSFFGSSQKSLNNVVTEKIDLNYYLPEMSYDASISTPESYLGFQVGEWHVSHDQLVGYMKLLASESDRITLETYAYSHEHRPLLLLTISSEDNQKRISDIQKEHVQLCDASKSAKLNIDKMPVVLYQGYSVHGNESSGANAALLVAYYLAAGEGKEVLDLLDNSVILLDPCYNPDGFQRFSSWVNMNKSGTLVNDPADREYNEVWPGGRTNHYWFDLNRDWLLLTHPESRGRIANFQAWKPNVLTDHHEMGTNSTFFFQPGVPERTNPNTPQLNQTLTEKIGVFHAKALDKIGSMYYTKESFDDFYYGKGSTYPDIQGSIGILFEQASSRGHAQESINGVLEFPFTIRNQVVTSLSTQEAGLKMRKEILEFQRDFYLDASKEAKRSKIKAYAFPKLPDFNKSAYLVDILRSHDIQVYADQQENGYYSVPVDQPQSRLIHIMMEQVTDFKVNIFYDVSTWTFPYAFDLEISGEESWTMKGLKEVTDTPKRSVLSLDDSTEGVAYAFEWHDWRSSTLLGMLLEKEIPCTLIHEPFTAETNRGQKSFDRGTVIVTGPLSERSQIFEMSKEIGIEVIGLKTGLTQKGVTLGSPSSKKLEKVKALMIIGSGVNAYDAGEMWHHMDQRLGLSLSKVEMDRIANIDLSRYNTIIMPDGNYRRLSDASVDKIKRWVRSGGNLLAFKRAISSLQSKKIITIETVAREASAYDDKSYSDRKEESAKHVIGGAIFHTNIDNSYPLFYGYRDQDLPVFKRGTLAIKADSSSLAFPMKYTSSPLASGYASKENIDRIAGTAGLFVEGYGSGRIVCSVDNPVFRGYWIGGNKLFDNMLYFSSSISRTGTKD